MMAGSMSDFEEDEGVRKLKIIARAVNRRVEGRIWDYIRDYEVEADLEPIERALRERKDNEGAKYYQLGSITVEKKSDFSAATFRNAHYGLDVHKSSRHNGFVFFVTLYDPRLRNFPSSADLSQRACLVLESTDGKRLEYELWPTDNIRTSGFTRIPFSELQPIKYIATLKPLEDLIT